MVDRFPEAFKRFEEAVNLDSFKSYSQLAFGFSYWAGRRWRDSYFQNLALRREARKRGFFDAKLPKYLKSHSVRQTQQSWRHEVLTVKGKSQNRYRDVKSGRFIKKPELSKHTT